MPRRARRDENSSFSHVMVQGIEKKYIFNKEFYKRKFYKIMIDKRIDNKMFIVAYCIMDNHAHILLNTENVDVLSKYMKSVDTAFAKFYNESENRVGYLFRDRFKSEPINTEQQLYNCIAYIHNNPVKANLVQKPDEYLYSSYNDYISQKSIFDENLGKQIFGSKQYLDFFKFIHYLSDEFIDYSEEIKKNHSEINNMIYNTNRLDEQSLYETCMLLKKYNWSNRKIAEVLHVSRNRINQIVKK